MIAKIIAYSCLFLWLFNAEIHAQSKTNIVRDPEYQQMLQQLNDRYEDFFIHQQSQKRWEVKRMSGIDEVIERRVRYQRQRERARKGFVRQPPLDREPLERKWEQKQKRLEAIREQEREHYVRKREELEKVRETARKIPEKQVVGLE